MRSFIILDIAYVLLPIKTFLFFMMYCISTIHHQIEEKEEMKLRKER